jgi:hypothetical protein
MIKKTIISHFYNEEFLLPWWLSHHKKYFDHGIMIDYNSTDKSLDIIRDICPTWEIRPSINKDFDAVMVDREVMDIESGIDGWKICLNTTEFILGNFNVLNNDASQLLVKCYTMIDSIENEYNNNLTYQKSIFEQRYHGSLSQHYKGFRSFHNHNVTYSTGRHWLLNENQMTKDFIILNYQYSPMVEELFKRKLQIFPKMSQNDISNGNGGHHKWSRNEMIEDFKSKQPYTENMLDFISQYENIG